ncbi:hypothetical protein [Kitasatospora fiedleri]|uniref:hypothetical protein n=1 Tax=Kitasatospora fiedleri TaxID=2991545 RepID=UPI00249AD723|nr:hypothetical protein [Kitasatospora fiedleri]
MAGDPVDAEAVLAQWARAVLDVRPCTDLPAALTDSLPLLQIVAIGGPAERFRRRPRIDLDCYAGTYADARDLALRVEDEVQRLRGRADPGAVVQMVRVDSGPARRPYENPGVHRVGLTISLRLHRASFA